MLPPSILEPWPGGGAPVIGVVPAMLIGEPSSEIAATTLYAWHSAMGLSLWLSCVSIKRRHEKKAPHRTAVVAEVAGVVVSLAAANYETCSRKKHSSPRYEHGEECFFRSSLQGRWQGRTQGQKGILAMETLALVVIGLAVVATFAAVLKQLSN